MNDTDFIRARIIPEIFILSRKLEMVSNRSFRRDDITTKQWLVLATIGQMGESATLTGIARELSMSHQNVKQIVLQLEKNGYIILERDAHDKRTVRPATTKKSAELWKKRDTIDKRNIDEFLSPLSDEESVHFSKMLHKLLENIEKMKDDI